LLLGLTANAFKLKTASCLFWYFVSRNFRVFRDRKFGFGFSLHQRQTHPSIQPRHLRVVQAIIQSHSPPQRLHDF
jgi:hypothetical protein